jgi:hypothetical protein
MASYINSSGSRFDVGSSSIAGGQSASWTAYIILTTGLGTPWVGPLTITVTMPGCKHTSVPVGATGIGTDTMTWTTYQFDNTTVNDWSIGGQVVGDMGQFGQKTATMTATAPPPSSGGGY